MDKEIARQIGPRDDMLRALTEALDLAARTIEKSRAAADHADDLFGTPNLVNRELCDLTGMLRVWHNSAAALLEDLKEEG